MSGTSASPTVSAVIPTYRREQLITRAVTSALAQTHPLLEVIVVDDASPDGTADVVHALDDPRLRLVRHAKNRGLASARNTGIENARGDWVAFLDDDDEWLPEKIERQLARVAQDGGDRVAAVYCTCYVQRANGERTFRPHDALPEGDLTEALFRRELPMTPTLFMVRRYALDAVGGFRSAARSVEDLDCWLRLCAAGYRFAAVPEPLAVWYATAGQMSKEPVGMLRAFRTVDRDWSALMRERLGEPFYHRWRTNRTTRIRRRHKRHIRELVRSGSRRDALAYVRNMLPFAPWGAAFVAKALAFAVVGRRAYRGVRHAIPSRAD